MKLKKMNFTLCLSLLLVTGVTFATEMETKIIDAKDVLTTPLVNNEKTRYVALACTTSHSVCSRLAGQYRKRQLLDESESLK